MNKLGFKIVVCHSVTLVSAVIVALPFLHLLQKKFKSVFIFSVATRYALRLVAVSLYDFVSLAFLLTIKICELICLLKARQL